MLRDFPWLYRSCCRWTCMEILSYCQNKHRQQSGGSLFLPCRWPLTQTTNSVQYKSFMHVSALFRHLCCIKFECMKEKNKWLKMRDGNTNTERHFSLPLQVPQTFLESNMRLSSRCHSNKNLVGDFTDRAESDSSSGQRWLTLLNKTKTLNRPIHEKPA